VIKLVPNVERSPRDFNSALGSSSSLEDLEGIGAGPFVLSKIDPNSLAEFKRNRYFWQADASGNQLPYLEGIRVVIIPMTIASVAQETAIFQFRNGQTDWIIPRPDDIVSLQSDKIKGFPVNDDFDSGQASSGITFWAVNWAARNPALRAVFRNRDFRVALSHLTDRDTMKKIIFKGMATDNYSFLNPNSPFYFERPDQTKEMLDRGEKAKFKFDPERANLILDRIGLKDTNRDGVRDIPENFDGQGNPAGRLEFTMITNEESDVRKFMAQEIATDAKRASIVIKVEMRRTEILSDSLKVGDYEAVLTQLGGGFTPESSANVYLCEGNLHFFNVDCPKNRTNFERELDDFYKKGIITRNFTEAQKHWDEVQIFISQFQPIIPLPQQNALFAYRTDVLRNHGRAPHLTQSFIYCLRSSCIGDTQK
jgi:peptide/nickel transport system substrate-binding protein